MNKNMKQIAKCLALSLFITLSCVACEGSPSENNNSASGGTDAPSAHYKYETSPVDIKYVGSEEQQEATTPGNGKTYKIAILNPGTTTFFGAFNEGCEDAANEFGVEIKIFEAAWDTATQFAQIEDVCMAGYDMVAFNCVDRLAGISCVDYANTNGIPVLATSNFLGSDDFKHNYEGVVGYVGQIALNTGITEAQLAMDLLGESGGKIVCIEGAPGTAAQLGQRMGLEQVLEGTNAEIVYTSYCDWQKELSMNVTEDLMQSGMDVNLFFCQDDVMAGGVGQILQEYGLKDQIYVTANCGTIQGLKDTKDGLIDANCYFSPYTEGYTTIQTCVKYLSGEAYNTCTEICFMPVTTDNVDSFVGEY